MKRFDHKKAMNELNHRNSEDSMDEFIIKDVRSYESLYNRCKDKVVFDMGANIGAFTYYCLQSEAKHVYSFEPSNENFALLESQPFDKDRVSLFKAAVSNEDVSEVSFFVNKGKCKASHSLITGKAAYKKTEEKIPAYAFKELCTKYKPDIIKCDIEYAEYMLDFPNDINEECKVFAIEIHLGRGYLERGNALYEQLSRMFPIELYKKDILFYMKPGFIVFIGARE